MLLQWYYGGDTSYTTEIYYFLVIYYLSFASSAGARQASVLSISINFLTQPMMVKDKWEGY